MKFDKLFVTFCGQIKKKILSLFSPKKSFKSNFICVMDIIKTTETNRFMYHSRKRKKNISESLYLLGSLKTNFRNFKSLITTPTL